MKTDLTRAKRLLEARKADPQVRADVEHAIAKDLLGPDIVDRDLEVRPTAFAQHRFLTPFDATEAFAKEVQRAVALYAGNIGAKEPTLAKYHPMLATPAMFKGVWESRQQVDDLGIPYWFYMQEAVLYWFNQGNKRVPRPTQLTVCDVAAHVLERWMDPAVRYHYPLFTDDWDGRFRQERYVGDDVQLAGLSLIDQRLDDARTLGFDPAIALGMLLERAISCEMAEDRYGSELVDRALKAREAGDREFAALVAGDVPLIADPASVDVVR